jgi:hypothetical protein
MPVEQQGSETEVGSEYVFGILEGIVDRYYLPRQRGGNSGSRRARAQAEMPAGFMRLAHGERAGLEGAGK